MYAKLSSALSRIEQLEALDRDKCIKIEKLESSIAVTRNVNSVLADQLNRTERIAIGNSQYALRETLEFHNFPADVPDNKVEEVVINLIKKTGIDAKPSDFQAVHRLKKRTTVVAKFISRKLKFNVTLARKNLKGKDLGKMAKIRIYESMCQPYAKLRFQLKKLQELKKLASFWFFNGRLFFKFVDDRAAPRHHISYVDDIIKHFPDVDIDNL
jgi:hypothetical protein